MTGSRSYSPKATSRGEGQSKGIGFGSNSPSPGALAKYIRPKNNHLVYSALSFSIVCWRCVMPSVNSVLGPLDTANIGYTLSHEHVLVASAGIQHTFPEFIDRQGTIEQG